MHNHHKRLFESPHGTYSLLFVRGNWYLVCPGWWVNSWFNAVTEISFIDNLIWNCSDPWCKKKQSLDLENTHIHLFWSLCVTMSHKGKWLSYWHSMKKKLVTGQINLILILLDLREYTLVRYKNKSQLQSPFFQQILHLVVLSNHGHKHNPWSIIIPKILKIKKS